MSQPRVSQTIFYHSEDFGVNAFNIRVYDRPEALEGEMWQVRWWRELMPFAGNDDYRIHTDWNTEQVVYPDFIYDVYGEEVCIPGWSYWWSTEVPASIPMLVNNDQAALLWERDVQGDVTLYPLCELNDPEYELEGK